MIIFKKKKSNINVEKLPKHIAFIIDGNGRWAKQRKMPRIYGHKVGVDAVIDTIKNCKDLGIKQVSFYCFSTENWNRPQKEIDAIFDLLKDFLNKKTYDYQKEGIRLFVSGDISKLDEDLQSSILNIVEKTKENTEMWVNICLNYGGRAEIIRAVNNIIKDGHKNVDENLFATYLYTKDFFDPDLIVRTSGENRISNFLLYQLAYSEFYFTKTYWPDFNKEQLEKAILDFESRKRRFGQIKE